MSYDNQYDDEPDFEPDDEPIEYEDEGPIGYDPLSDVDNFELGDESGIDDSRMAEHDLSIAPQMSGGSSSSDSGDSDEESTEETIVTEEVAAQVAQVATEAVVHAAQVASRGPVETVSGHPDETPEEIRDRVDAMARTGGTHRRAPLLEGLQGDGQPGVQPNMAEIVSLAVQAALAAVGAVGGAPAPVASTQQNEAVTTLVEDSAEEQAPVEESAADLATKKPAVIQAANDAPDLAKAARVAKGRVERQDNVLPSARETHVTSVEPEEVEVTTQVVAETSGVSDTGGPSPYAASTPQTEDRAAKPVAGEHPLQPARRRKSVPEYDDAGAPFIRKDLADSELAKVDRFPKELLVLLRRRLAIAVGEEPGSNFTAEAKGRSGLSNTTLLVGFVLSVLGDEFIADDQTQLVADYFASSDPRLDQMDRKLTEIMGSLGKVDRRTRAMGGNMEQIRDTTSATELATMFLLGDRAVGFPELTRNQTPASVDVTHPSVIDVRDTTRKRAIAQSQTERDRMNRTNR